MVDEVVRLGFVVDPVLTLGELRHGSRDPLVRFEARRRLAGIP